MNNFVRNQVITLLTAFLVLSSCKETVPDSSTPSPSGKQPVSTTEIFIEAEDFTGSGKEVESVPCEEGGKQVVLSSEIAWLSYDVDIPVAGRYKVEVRVTSEGQENTSIWIEDYIGNKDGRTYNITGNMTFSEDQASDGFVSLSKDGSPLNAGTHPIKLHLQQGQAAINWIKFTLIREHQLTPETMTQATEGTEWTLAWSDEFDGEGLPDNNKWTYDIGDWGWGNNELQYYTANRLKNARQENGNLIIEAHKNDEGNAWTSARLTTRGKVSFLYGRIEFRAKVPPQRGNWAAGWTLGDEYRDEMSWPYCGEIDILESVGYEMDDASGDGKAHASIHCGAYYFKLGNQPTSTLDVSNMHEAFHTYAVDWTPEGIKAYVDDHMYFEYTDTSTELAWPFSKPQNLILNLAMGGGWGGLQGMDENMTRQQFVIDYVRVYERK